MKDVYFLSSKTLEALFKWFNKLRFMMLIDYSTQCYEDVNSFQIKL